MFLCQTQTAFRVVKYLYGRKQWTGGSEIVKEFNISISYVDQIMRVLVDNDLAAGLRGPGGGYVIDNDRIARLTLSAFNYMFDESSVNNKLFGAKLNQLSLHEALDLK